LAYSDCSNALEIV